MCYRVTADKTRKKSVGNFAWLDFLKDLVWADLWADLVTPGYEGLEGILVKAADFTVSKK